jgi:hypothetical protein
MHERSSAFCGVAVLSRSVRSVRMYDARID